jgi:hypothetical protein
MKRSRSILEPDMRPLFTSFEDAGVGGALARWRIHLQERAPSLALALPAWVWSLDFSLAVTECARCGNAPALVAHLRDARRALTDDADAAARGDGDGEWGAEPAVSTTQQSAAIVRLCLGEVLEALAARMARAVVADDDAPGPDVDKRALSTLYYDSYCAAVWTSAHAEYLGCIHDLLGNQPVTEARVRAFMVPSPELYTVANMSHLLHLGTLMERTASPRCCSKSSQALLAILTRVTNAGSRGWETTLLAALKESDGAVRVCMQCLAVALTGLNSAVHPAHRRPWRERFALGRVLRAQTQQDFRQVVNKAPNAVKEAIRLHLAATFVADRATLDAMRHARHPTGQLCVPPVSMPAISLAAAMHRIVDAGADLLTRRETVAAAIQRSLVSEPRSRKKAESRASRHHKHEPEALTYSSSWLGGRSGPSSLTVRPAVQVVSGLFSASYRSIFIPYWLHGNHHGHRASRLDSAQYVALHHQSAAHRMCTLLPIEQYQKAERLALANADASLLTVAQACALLGTSASADATPGLPCSASSRSVQDAEVEVMNLGADDAALLVAFARIATLRSMLLSYDLGAQTKRKQALAICQRLLLPLAPDEDPCVAVQTRLPQHATVLYCCSECRRVVNSVQDNTGKEVAFNELGLSASMLTIDCKTCVGHMRCAKRSSAALRTAVALEASAERLELEQLDPVASPLLPSDLRPATIVATMCGPKGTRHSAASTSAAALRDSSSEVAKFRRDLKSCFEQGQQATSCGDVPLVRVPILGRATRVFNNWYALCSMCGGLARVSPSSRFRDEICCMRCDFAMLAGKKAWQEMCDALPRPPPPSCRYCGKVEPVNGAGMKWKRVDAPADTGGRNAFVPPPLRVCWCAQNPATPQPPHPPPSALPLARAAQPSAHRSQKVLPVALPRLARERAQGHADGRHLCAPGEQGAAHHRRGRGHLQQQQATARRAQRRWHWRRGEAAATQRRHKTQDGACARHRQEQSPKAASGVVTRVVVVKKAIAALGPPPLSLSLSLSCRPAREQHQGFHFFNPTVPTLRSRWPRQLLTGI